MILMDFSLSLIVNAAQNEVVEGYGECSQVLPLHQGIVNFSGMPSVNY